MKQINLIKNKFILRKYMYKFKIISISLLFGVFLFSGCSTPKQTYYQPILPLSNEVQCLEAISGSSYHYIAWGIGINNPTAEMDALKAAVYAAMVNGSSDGNCTQLMNSNERNINQEYIKRFFSNESTWLKYITSSNQGKIDQNKRLNLNDGTVKVGVDVIVNIKNLREDLERDGVLGDMRIK